MANKGNNKAGGTAKGSEAKAGADNPPAPPAIPTPPAAATPAAAQQTTTPSPEAGAIPPLKGGEPKGQPSKSVRVISKGTLGPLLLKNGDVTDDPAYVAILQVKGQRKVEEVK